MAGPRKVKRSKRTYKKKTYKRKAKTARKTKFNTKSNARFIKKVVNRTLHPEKKRYNCLRVSTTSEPNRDWAINGITVNSVDINVIRPVTDTNDPGLRSPWFWYQLNTRPVLASSDTFYSIEGSKMNLKYIYIKGHVRFTRLNANNASARELLTRIGIVK